MHVARAFGIAMDRTSKAGEATEHVGAPGDRGLNEVEVRSTHKVLGTSHVGSVFFDSSKWQGKESRCGSEDEGRC